MKRVTGPGRRAGESVFRTAWQTVTGVEPVESFPYSAPREGVLGPEVRDDVGEQSRRVVKPPLRQLPHCASAAPIE